MGISPENFLNRYFGIDELKESLSDIGLPVGGTKKERVKRIIENWISHHRDWYELLDYLDLDTLSQICDDFNIQYSNYAKEATLCNKIEEEYVLDFRKKQIQIKKPTLQNSPNKEKSTNKKISPYIVVAIIAWMIVGISFSLLNLTGVFIPTHEESIKISKEYMVYFGQWTDENTYTGQAVGMNLSGKITFESTLFSAQNPIDVKIELVPNTSFGLDESVFLQSLPQPLSVFFVNTSDSNDESEDNDDVTRILLKKSTESEKLIGTGTIVYSQGGTHKIYVTDPRETSLMTKLMTINKPPGSVILFPVPDPPNNIKRTDENGNPILIPSRIELTSESEPYFMEIRQSDALNSLEAEKRNTFAIWLAITLTPVGIVIPLLMRR